MFVLGGRWCFEVHFVFLFLFVFACVFLDKEELVSFFQEGPGLMRCCFDVE